MKQKKENKKLDNLKEIDIKISSLYKNIGKLNQSLLNHDEEIDLAKRIESGDKKAREKMINSNMRLAISMAKNYMLKNKSKRINFEDLIQESSIGLIKAVDKYDWKKGFKFSTYACWWIRLSIQDYVFSNSISNIKIPRNSSLTIYKLEKFKKEYAEEFGGKEPSEKEITEYIGMSMERIKSMQQGLSNNLSLNRYSTSNGSDVQKNQEDYLLTREVLKSSFNQNENLLPDEMIERNELANEVIKSLSKLSPKEEMIVRMRFGITGDLEK